jgi:hypothetical protein
MKRLWIALLMLGVLGVLVSTATGQQSAEPARNRNSFEVFREDWEGGGLPGWTFLDRSGGPSEFHVSTYYAYDDGTPPNYSYWCGTFDYDADGGYGDGWREYLELPSIDLTDAVSPRLSFRYRHHSVNVRDVARVEVKHLGEYRELVSYAGNSVHWQQQLGLDIQPFDNPLEVRFHFRSNISVSDETAPFNSVAGAFHVDEIRVHEFAGDDYFFDDVEDGVGLCSPVDVPPTGIVPHLIELPCRAYSDPTCMNACEPGDTTSVPPNVFFSSVTPSIHVEGASECTLFQAIHYCMPHEAGGKDEILIDASVDGGTTWSQVAYVMNPVGLDYPGCNQFGPSGLAGWNLSYLLPATSLMVRSSMLADDDGIGPGVSGAGGVFTDDIWVVVDTLTTTIQEGMSWGRVKSLYR